MTTDDKSAAHDEDPTPANRPPASLTAEAPPVPPVQETGELMGFLRGVRDEVEKLKHLAGEVLTKAIDDVRAGLADVVATVANHADLLDGLQEVLAEINKAAPKAAPEAPRRERTLPAPAQVKALAPGEKREETLQIDPTKVGEHLAKLPSGQEVLVRVRRPGPGEARTGRMVRR